MKTTLTLTCLAASLFCLTRVEAAEPSRFVPLFPEDGVPKGWVVRDWADLRNAPKEPVVWKVEKGILRGGTPRGTWLVSEREYRDFLPATITLPLNSFSLISPVTNSWLSSTKASRDFLNLVYHSP